MNIYEADMNAFNMNSNPDLDLEGKILPSMWIKLGYRKFKSGNWWDAIECAEKVLKRNPNHVMALVTRSKCYTKIYKHEEAKRDIDLAFHNDSNHEEVLRQVAELQYVFGNYGDSFKTFEKASNLYPHRKRFKDGMEACATSMLRGLDCEEPVHAITDYVTLREKIFPRLEKEPKELKTKKEQPPICFSCKKVNIYGKTREDRKTLIKVTENEELKQYFEEVYPDLLRHYLEHTKPIPPRQPSLKFKLVDIDLGHKPKILRFADSYRVYANVKNSYKESYNAFKNGDYNGCIKAAYDILRPLRSVTDDVMPHKQRFRTDALNLIGKAYREQGDLEKALSFHMKEDSILEEYDMATQRRRSLRSIGEDLFKMEEYAEANLIFQKALQFYNEVYVVHKIGLCQMHLGNLAEAERCALYCLKWAEDRKDAKWAEEHKEAKWAFNAYILLAATAIKADDHDRAFTFLDNAIAKTNDMDESEMKNISLDILTQIPREKVKDATSKEMIENLRLRISRPVVKLRRKVTETPRKPSLCEFIKNYPKRPDSFGTYRKVKKILKTSLRAWKEGDCVTCLDSALDLLKTISQVHEDLLPGKSRYKIHALTLISKVYRKCGESDTANAFEEIENALKVMFDTPSFRGRFLSYLSGNYANIQSVGEHSNHKEELISPVCTGLLSEGTSCSMRLTMTSDL